MVSCETVAAEYCNDLEDIIFVLKTKLRFFKPRNSLIY